MDGASNYYECFCQWLQSHEGTMRQLIGQVRSANSQVCTETECFENGTCTRAGQARAASPWRAHR